jgi:hypothetical protein
MRHVPQREVDALADELRLIREIIRKAFPNDRLAQARAYFEVRRLEANEAPEAHSVFINWVSETPEMGVDERAMRLYSDLDYLIEVVEHVDSNDCVRGLSRDQD